VFVIGVGTLLELGIGLSVQVIQFMAWRHTLKQKHLQMPASA
jgi:hypothetical protein